MRLSVEADMSGMDHGGDVMPSMDHGGGAAMPGMDPGGGDAMPGMGGGEPMPGMDHGAGAAMPGMDPGGEAAMSGMDHGAAGAMPLMEPDAMGHDATPATDPMDEGRMPHGDDDTDTFSGLLHDRSAGVEWNDEMPGMNRMSTPENTVWKMIDEETGKVNMDVKWNFNVGDAPIIEIYNDPSSAHPMHHPIHFHGQRFLVASVDGEENENLAWKDTVTVLPGERVRILLEVTNPGKWMAHCHIAEHLEAGMMTGFDVDGEWQDGADGQAEAGGTAQRG